jgi:hypothetical protein
MLIPFILNAAMAKKSQPTSEAPEIVFEYIKSNLFRVIHCDGAIGGVTPSGNLHIAFFSERAAIPRTLVHSRGEMGTLGPLIPERTQGRPSVIREMDVDVVVAPRAVDALIAWLQQQKLALEAYELQRSKIQNKASKKKSNGRKQ